MKTQIRMILGATLVAIGAGASALALPVLNMNAPGAETVTLYPDHQNPNVYYTAPRVMLGAKSEEGVPYFSYSEYKEDWFTKYAIVQLTMRPEFNDSERMRIIKEIKSRDPKALFSGVTFVDSKMIFSDTLKPLIEKQECAHRAGVLGDEQVCTFVLNSKGRHALLPMLLTSVGITIQLEYQIKGVVQKADGTYENHLGVYRMGGRIGGPELRKYPELFRDPDGDLLDLPPAPSSKGNR